MPLKTLLIVHDFAHNKGGSGQVALNSAFALAARGLHVVFFSAVGPVMPELLADGRIEVICTGQWEILEDPNRIRAMSQGLWNLKARAAFARLLDSLDRQTTIIHVHGWSKALSSSIVRVALNRGFRLVCTMHDYFLACPNGLFYNYATEQICRLTPLSLACLRTNCDARSYSHKLWRFSRSIVERRIGRLPDGIKHLIAVSDFSLAILKPFLPPDAQIYLVNNPVDVAKKAPTTPAQQRTFIGIGRISREKGFDLFARAAASLGVDATLVGDGYYRDAIQALCPSMRITGWRSRSEVEAALRSARALVFPSPLYETSGLVVLEAAAAGVPAIVPDTSAAREYVDNGVTGLWFRGGDVEDLRAKMQALADDELVSRLGKAAYHKYWANPYTLERHTDALVKVYHQILDCGDSDL